MSSDLSLPRDYRRLGCAECVHGNALGFDLSMAFQPIVDLERRTVSAHEALARGLANEPAGTVVQQVDEALLAG